MNKRRVVITGLGLVTPLGIGVDTVWPALLAGKSGIGQITLFDASGLPTTIAGQVPGFDAADYLDPIEIRRADRFIHFALIAAEEALKNAGLAESVPLGERAGVIIGSGIGGIGTVLAVHDIYREKGVRRVPPTFIPSVIVNLAAGNVSIKFGAKGPHTAPATACTAGTHAIGDSFRLIARGDADVMIAGGAEAPICDLGMAGFCAMRAMSTRNDDPAGASRPFDADRDGFVMGEGSGIVILEERERALARGATVYAEVIGYSMTADAFHITKNAPEGEGATRTMRLALEDAGIKAEDVGYINAHGTSTPANDPAESQAIRQVFGDHADKLAVGSTKSMTGHLLGAAGGIEAVFSALALTNGILPPTINQQTPDPECDLDFIAEGAREAGVTYAMSNSFGFGGANGCLVLRKHEADS